MYTYTSRGSCPLHARMHAHVHTHMHTRMPTCTHAPSTHNCRRQQGRNTSAIDGPHTYTQPRPGWLAAHNAESGYPQCRRGSTSVRPRASASCSAFFSHRTSSHVSSLDGFEYTSNRNLAESAQGNIMVHNFFTKPAISTVCGCVCVCARALVCVCACVRVCARACVLVARALRGDAIAAVALDVIAGPQPLLA